ncbi:MAG TPA: hypothetical protein VMU92_03920 [Acidobacteriaceae bacterium]|nr:hypothetical protein [Acidobacteriaceae bacterium]
MSILGLRRATALLVMVGMTVGVALGQSTAQGKQDAGQSSSAQKQPSQKPTQGPKPEMRITPQQARELFASVDTILHFASEDTELPIVHKVKRRLTTRAAVEKYLEDKMKNGKDARRMERSEIVLKKFGMLDEDFHLEPFLMSLLKEQIAGYYDSKTKTVNLLDWVAPDEQKPVLAHELTHALQDQRVNLTQWDHQSSDARSKNVAEDNRHIATDETDTARDAVLEGQAMAVYVDYELKPFGRSILTNPEGVKKMADAQGTSASSPVLARAPLVLHDSLLFPYQAGLKFEVDMLVDKGRKGAFAGVLDHPPSSTYEIMNPRAYEDHVKVPVLTMPDVHGLLDAQYNPYDVGVMGQLDVRMLTELYGGPNMAARLAPEWDGGIYYVAQKKSAPDKDSTASTALLYLSQWKTPEAAQAFAKMYAGELGQQYSHVVEDTRDESGQEEVIYNSNEGPMLISTHGRLVFVSESFPLPLARKLGFLMVGAQKGDDFNVVTARVQPMRSLTGGLVDFMQSCGVMRAALHLY